MGLFSSKKPADSGKEFRGGCAAHDMRGPARKTFGEANKDANGHSNRLHGGADKNPNAYVEINKK